LSTASLTDADIEAILAAMGPAYAGFDPDSRAALKEESNRLWETARSMEALEASMVPHRELERIRQIQEAARALVRAMRESSFRNMEPIEYADPAGLHQYHEESLRDEVMEARSRRRQNLRLVDVRMRGYGAPCRTRQAIARR
jgi:hypothetical protein